MSLMDRVRSLPGWSRARRTYVAASSRVQELWYGIDTYVPTGSNRPAFEDDLGYEPTKFAAIRKVIRAAPPHPHDVFFDIGCGMGRVLCMYARRKMKGCVGVERNVQFAAKARRNAEKVRGRRTPIEVVIEDATIVDYREGTYFFFYNPFGEQTMRKVLDRIRESLLENPRHIRIAYVNPRFEQVLREQSWLRCVTRFKVAYWVRNTYPATIWENVTQQE